MNRETKRMLQRQGQLQEDGSPALATKQRPAPKPTRERTSPVEFLREVRAELRKVAWPTRSETINYSTVVLFTLVVLVSFVFFIDYGFASFVKFLFKS